MHQKQIVEIVDARSAAILALTQGQQREQIRRELQAMRADLLDLAITEDAPMDYCLGCGDVIATESGQVCRECGGGKSDMDILAEQCDEIDRRNANAGNDRRR